jgi:formamidopyrimidine-DNA glycosylase
MSGDVLIQSKKEPPGKHHRLSLNFKNGLKFSFIDPRKFGRAWFVKNTEQILSSLGPEPLSDEFTPTSLFKGMSRHSRQIKPLLMDQTFIAGLGNIYTDEALFNAKINPKTKSDQISRNQSDHLYESIKYVLLEGIKNNGASIDWVYRGGDFQNYFQIYSRKGEKCMDCGDEIIRIIVGQRSTFICPTCQPDPETN